MGNILVPQSTNMKNN